MNDSMSDAGNHPRPVRTTDFLISYTQTDRESAEWIATTLEGSGYTTTLQAWDFSPGSNFVIEMHNAVGSARQTLAVLSPDYLNSAYATSEWAAALADDPMGIRRKLIPVRVRTCQPGGLLKAINYIDLVDLNNEEAGRALLEGIKAGRQTSNDTPRFPVRPVNSVGRAILVAVIGVAILVVPSVWRWFRPPLPELYRIRLTVLDSGTLPVDNAKVWSSFGGEAKRVDGGWEFNIPRSAIPKNGLLTVFASRASAFEIGSSRLQLARDPNPAATLRLERDLSAQVRGIVVDSKNRTIGGARVCVVGFESEAIATGPTGGFVLAAHAADGQQVQLHVEKQGYGAISEFHPAGYNAVTITLDSEH